MIKEYHAGDEGSGQCGQTGGPGSDDRKVRTLLINTIAMIGACELGIIPEHQVTNALTGMRRAYDHLAKEWYGTALDEKINDRMVSIGEKIKAGKLPG